MRVTGGQVFDLEQGFVSRDVCTDGALLTAASGDGQVLDASGCYVIPGLVDVHFHGCVGEDFSDATPEGLQRIADYELSQGVTYYFPTNNVQSLLPFHQEWQKHQQYIVLVFPCILFQVLDNCRPSYFAMALDSKRLFPNHPGLLRTLLCIHRQVEHLLLECTT